MIDKKKHHDDEHKHDEHNEDDQELSLEELEDVSGGSLKDMIDFESGGGGDW